MTYLTIPFAIELTDESSWEPLDQGYTSFGIVRFHFRLDDTYLGEPHKVGDPIGVYQKPNGVTTKHVKSDTTEIEQVVSAKSIEHHLLQNEVMAEIASDLTAKGGLKSLLTLDLTLKSKISQKLSSSFAVGIELSSSEKVTRTETLIIENQIAPEIEESIVSVPVYKRRAIDITLGYIDYLRVDYTRSVFGLRKKARKYPSVKHPHYHPNRLKFGVPIATAYYWELLHKSSKFMFERLHKLEVSDPLQITICEPRSNKEKYVDFPKVPTLYQIANVAFPKKWIWRRSQKQNWTEDELKNIEFQEVLEKPGWWQLYGRGR